MPTVKNGAVYYVQEPKNHIEPGVHVKYVEEEIDLDNVPLNGGVLLKTLYLSSDPYLRYRMRDPAIEMFCPPMLLGDPIDNAGIGRVLRSEDPELKEGDVVYGYLEFREYHVYPGNISHFYKFPLTKVDRLPNFPLSIYVGTLGMPGSTAYQGLKGFATTALKEKVNHKGEVAAPTMFVPGAAGPVGTFVIEYAKHLNPKLKIIASAGSAKKVEILKSVGADVAFNYKEEDTFQVLKREGPIDIYWDNVAGPTLDAALLNFNYDGLIISCGAISQAGQIKNSVVQHFEEIFQRNITVKGYIVYTGEAAPVLADFHKEAIPLVLEGKITSREHRYQGLQEAGRAMADLHHGHNTGKAVIVVSEEY